MTLEIISHPLALPPVAQKAMSGAADARYEPRPSGKDAWIARAKAVAASVPGDWLARLEPALSARGEAAAKLALCAGGKGIVVTTGQQPGLFGGPVYTLSKALSAHALASELEKLTGIPVAPIFWAATDDTDYREAGRVAIALPGGARELVMEPPAQSGTTMSKLPLGDVRPLIAEMAAASGSGVDPSAVGILEKFYNSGNTVGSAYVELLRELFEPLGIAVLDAAHEAVRDASAQTVKLALEKSDEIAKAIAANNAAIQQEGHTLQVQDVAGLSLVFENTPSGRRRIPRKRGARDIAPDAELGPNVLLRPIVERQILPTVAYVGGPAEIAYFTQLGPIADTLGVPRPLIVPRWSGTILEPHVKRIVEKLGVAMEDFRDPHAVETRVAREKLPESVHRELAAFRSAVDDRAASLLKITQQDSALVSKAMVEGLKQNLAHRLDRFERRAVAASKRRNADLMQDAATARGSLFPLGKPQERALSFIPFIARYGHALQDALLAEITSHVKSLL